MVLSKDEQDAVKKMEGNLSVAFFKNLPKNQAYYQLTPTDDFGINTPENLSWMNSVLGWPGHAVDILVERVNFRYFYSPYTEDASNMQYLSDIARENFAEVQLRSAQKDSMITGAGFISVGKGNTALGEPEIVWKAENSSTVTVLWDHRSHRVTMAFKRYKSDGVQYGTLMNPYESITMVKRNSKWQEATDIPREQNFGFVPVVPIFNNSDSIRDRGRSEITRAVRYFTAAGKRTLVTGEVNRELYTSPLRMLIGASTVDVEGITANGDVRLKTAAGDIVTVPLNLTDGNEPIKPDLVQLTGGSPKEVMEMLEVYATLTAHEIGTTKAGMGFESTNPSSAEAINAAEQKLIRKAQYRIPPYKQSLKMLAEYTLRLAGRPLGNHWPAVDMSFERVDTVTPAAQADRMMKMTAAGVFDKPFPDFVYEELGLTEIQILQTKEFVRKNTAANNVFALAGSAPSAVVETLPAEQLAVGA